MIRSERESKLFQVIAQQTLGRADLVWLAKNNRECLDWSAAAQSAFDEGIAPLLYYHCRNMNIFEAIPESTKKFLARTYAETSLINRHLLQEMTDLEKALEKRDIQVIVLKGAALLNTVYRDVALRPMEDIDLMVRPEHLEELKAVFAGMGFTPDKLYPYTFKRGIITLDLHNDYLSTHRVRSRQAVAAIRFEDVWARAIPISPDHGYLLKLSIYDELIAQAFHLLKHRFNRLIWFVDIRESIENHKDAFDWVEFIRRCRGFRAQRVVLYMLLLARRLLAMDVPDHVLNSLGKDDLSPVEIMLLRLRIANFSPRVLTDLLWLFQILGFKSLISFIIENFYPRKEIMKQIFPDAKRPFPIAAGWQRFTDIASMGLSDMLSALKTLSKGNLPHL